MNFSGIPILRRLCEETGMADSRCKPMGYQVLWKYGEVREWLNRAVSKTVEPLRVPWVRIPPSPQNY